MLRSDNAEDSLEGMRILLVEDDPLICLDLETSLVELGALVTSASDVARAVQAIADEALDFAILDFELRAETSEPIAVAARARKLPFLFLSGYGEQDARFERWPGIHILVKPLSVATITRGIWDVLRARD